MGSNGAGRWEEGGPLLEGCGTEGEPGTGAMSALRSMLQCVFTPPPSAHMTHSALSLLSLPALLGLAPSHPTHRTPPRAWPGGHSRSDSTEPTRARSELTPRRP